MGPNDSIPCLPENAPFTPEQRAYLNGFLAGLFSRTSAPASAAPAAAPPALEPLAILFGSQTGNAERLAKRIARDAGQRGFAATIYEMATYPMARLASEKHVLCVTSTYGDGEPPDNARAFWDLLSNENAPALSQLRFSVCALGDSNYPKFCAFGKSVDERFEKLGGQRVQARVDCDVEFEAPFQTWLGAALTALRGIPAPTSPAGITATASDPTEPAASTFGRNNPFPAPLLANRRLNGDGSAKDTRHFAFDLDGSGLDYAAGDALGVFPTNCPELVDELVRALGGTGEELVPAAGREVPLREGLLRHFDITRIQSALLKALAERTGDELLQRLTAPGVNGELTKFLHGREVIDLLLAHPTAKFTPVEFVALLKKLQPRLYSISSSPKAHAGQVHLCVGVVRYDSLGRKRKGVCSTFLADRVADAAAVPVFFHSNQNFRPPATGETPMIMVGPGTGIAPFRAFLHDRRAAGATGRNWLFFGDQRASSDFLFRDELEGFVADGFLHRLDTAFSRDQDEKVYVQNRMLEHAAELYSWLEAGAHFYVCGDASRMAKDVDAALHQIVQTAGGRTPEQAVEYIKALKAAKRYQRDVY